MRGCPLARRVAHRADQPCGVSHAMACIVQQADCNKTTASAAVTVTDADAVHAAVSWMVNIAGSQAS